MLFSVCLMGSLPVPITPECPYVFAKIVLLSFFSDCGLSGGVCVYVCVYVCVRVCVSVC